jgi:hypothetical protein
MCDLAALRVKLNAEPSLPGYATLLFHFRYHDHRLHVALIEQFRGERLDILWRDGVDHFKVVAMVVLAVKILGAQDA